VLSFRGRFRIQLQLQDILALVVGYGMAALLFRAFWPATIPAILLGLPVLLLYVWLGLAMSGPIILLRASRAAESGDAPLRSSPIAMRTWAETAWILIGIYWIVLGLFVIPARLHDFRLTDAVLYGVVPILVTVALRFLGPLPSPVARVGAPWTHFVAVGLLVTWPFAWMCLMMLGIMLGKSTR
jgi:hypothetical protein